MLFQEERDVLSALLEEWYENMHAFTEMCDGIFSEKAKQYDRESPIWTRRVRWPHGYVQELSKKVDRLGQMLSSFDPDDPAGSVAWSEVHEELADVVNYSRMMAAITKMVLERSEVK